MIGRLLLLVACFLAASCARDWDGRDSAGRRPFASQASVVPGVIRPLLSTAHTPRAIASLPDRGDLAAYPGKVIRRDGAYTWHRADISEEHALRAIVDGHLTITAPSGEVLQFAYERHVEHESGDWTWIGRLEDGTASDDAILTFGERAVFGNIAQPGKEPLKLRIRDGVSWLVETDRVALGRIVNTATRPRGPDYLLPPDMGQKTESDAPIGMASGPVAVNSTPPSGTTVVDAVLGYTSGFAAGLGSQSAAVTRLNFLVDVVNESYVNSQVAARIRLVHTVQVGYPDATSNETTLEELTGYKSGTGFITPNPAFDALRAARDQYGADLVSLVRKFNDPENGGCGIAWLIGGGQSGIDGNDAPFGYSVMSDGTDVGTDGKTYFCREETLAHEFGHNMGSQHDRETAKGDDGSLDAKDYGVYPYSFGYKTTAGAGNFYTIMAYGDTGQTRYRVFSNPRITFCGGFACGINNQADNALSLGQTIPIIATFRAMVVPFSTKARNDINGDGRSDLIWHNATQGRFGYWLLSGPTVTQMANIPVTVGYRIAATGDFNGDNFLDVIWTSNAGDLWLWSGTGSTTFFSNFLGYYGDNWAVIGAGDINKDNKDDVLWHNPVQGRFGYWLMNGATVLQMVSIPVTGGYRVPATGDFNGDGFLDVMWTSDAGDLWLWSGTGTSAFASNFMGSYGSGWKPIGSGDANADGTDDLIWHNQVQGRFGYWLMNGAIVLQMVNIPVTVGYRVASAGDYNGDAKLDVFWTSSAGDLWLWSGDGGGSFASNFMGSYSDGWQVVDPYVH